MSPKPKLVVVGGPNGAGKTTLARLYESENNFPYLGADAIAASLNPADPMSARVQAGRNFIRTIDEAIFKKQSLVVESTLSGRLFMNKITNAIANDFEVAIVFVFVESADLCVKRVAERVRKGGHHVPEKDIRR